MGTEELSHPAVELPLPLDGATHRYEIPTETSLFCWDALAAGTQHRLPRTRTGQGARLFQTAVAAQDQMHWTIKRNGESFSLLTDSYFRKAGYKGVAWWTACASTELPVSLDVQFETTGPSPTQDGERVVLWSRNGERIPWGTTIKSTIRLHPSDADVEEFSTHREQLWERHQVYHPDNA